MKKAFKIFTIASTLVIVVCWSFMMVFPEAVLSLMLPDADFTKNDLFNFRMMIFAMPLFPLFFMSTTLFQAVGKAKEAGFMTVLRDLGLFIPAVILLPIYFGVSGVYWGGVPSNVIMLGVCVWLLWGLFKKWEKLTNTTS
ncbi:MAG: hypothetical protein R2788_09750 [Saprospiraceae bacterium]